MKSRSEYRIWLGKVTAETGKLRESRGVRQGIKSIDNLFCHGIYLADLRWEQARIIILLAARIITLADSRPGGSSFGDKP